MHPIGNVSTNARLLCLLSICLVAAVASGVVRFGSGLTVPPVWLDVVFLVSCAGVLAVVLVLMIMSLHRHHDRPGEPDHRGGGSRDGDDGNRRAGGM